MVSIATTLIVVFAVAVIAFTVWIFRLSLDDAHSPGGVQGDAEDEGG